MFKTLKENLEGIIHQEKVNKLYETVLLTSYDLGVDFTALLKELNEIDKQLRVEESKKEEVKEEKK